MIIAELMILGFISLLLTFGQSYIAKICVPQDVAGTMLPCKKEGSEKSSSTEGEHRRALLWFDRRFLAGAESAVKCKDVSVYAAKFFMVDNLRFSHRYR
jgi:mlo protein